MMAGSAVSQPQQRAQQRLNTVVSHLIADVTSHASPAAAKQQQQNATSSSNGRSSTRVMKPAMIVTVTGAAGNIANSLLWLIGTGHLLGDDQPIELRLLEIPRMAAQLRAVVHELQDSCLPLITTITATTDYKTAFDRADIALLLGGKPKVPGIKRRQLLQANGHIFTAQGAALNQYASRDVKVVVVATPALTNALICQQNAPDLPPHNFTALTRLDHNRSIFQLAFRIGCSSEQIHGVAVMGNGSKTQHVDVSRATVSDWPQPGVTSTVRAAVNDDAWLDGDFLLECVNRGHGITKIKQKSTAASAAAAIVQHINTWLHGTDEGETVSMAVLSDGSYGVPRDIFFSFPVTCTAAAAAGAAADGSKSNYSIVRDCVLDASGRQRIQASITELLEERAEANFD